MNTMIPPVRSVFMAKRRKWTWNKRTLSGTPLQDSAGKAVGEKARSGQLTTPVLEKYIAKLRKMGYPVKYSKPIGFRRKK